MTSRTTLVFVAALLFLALPAPGHTSKLDPLARRGLERVRSGMSLEALGRADISVGRRRDLDVFVTGSVSRAALEAAGVRVRTQLPGVFTAYVPAWAMDRVAALPGVTAIQGAVEVEPLLDASVPTTGASALRGPAPDFAGFNGAGVLIGVVDSGVDLDHPDFLKPDGTTRILYVWDQTDSIGPRPSEFDYGTQWTAAEIDLDVAREIDEMGHGTHVLGIAGGDGSATGGSVPAFTYVGMAPKADLAMVKTSFTTGIVDGVAYLMSRAAALGKNVVVNLSLGSLYGPKDGSSAYETALNALTGLGRIVVNAAGNDRGKSRHAETSIAPGGNGVITLSIGGSAAGSEIGIYGYYGSASALTLAVTTPGGAVLGPIAVGDSSGASPGALTGNGVVYFENGLSATSRGDRQVYVDLSIPDSNITNASMDGLWTFTFHNSGTTPAQVDLWTFHRSNPAFFVAGRTEAKLLVEPSNAPDVITVAAWNTKTSWIDCGGRKNDAGSAWQVGGIALFSSPGPTRDGRWKPDLAAPGFEVAAASTFDIPVVCSAQPDVYLGDGMQHTILEGTSMAAPHVAGAVAMLMQKNGAMTPDQVKAFLFTHAVVDSFTGVPWNPDWGYGKLHLGNLDFVSAETNQAEVYLALASANPARGPVSLEFGLPRAASIRLEVFDLAGRRVTTLASGLHAAGRHPARWSPDRGQGAGVYFVRLAAPGGEWVRRLVLTR